MTQHNKRASKQCNKQVRRQSSIDRATPHPQVCNNYYDNEVTV